MNDINSSVFRPDAVRRYIATRQAPVLPRFVTPRTFFVLWIFLALLAATGIATWLAAAAAILGFQPIPPGLPALAILNSVSHAGSEVGTRHVIPLLPLSGQLAGA